MAKQLLNEAEALLLDQWKDAHLLERSMERVRKKYNALYSQVVTAVKDRHTELDASVNYMSQRGGEGQIAFSRRSWPEGESVDPPGLWMVDLRLDLLVDESEPPPTALIYVPPKAIKKMGTDRSAMRKQLLSRAATLLTPGEFDRYVDRDRTGNSLIYFCTMSKREVLNAINPNEGKGLIAALMAQFDLMAKLIPAIDELLGAKTPVN